MEPIKLFIGSGEASVIERKVFMYSVLKHTKRPVDFFVFNGTHNSIEKNRETPVLAPMPLHIKYKNVTEFSNYRWYIPQLCGYNGKAIFADSDMICLDDIGNFFDQDLSEYDLLAKGNAYQSGAEADISWGLSLCLFDCSKARLDVEQIFLEIDNGAYSLTDLHQMKPSYLKLHPYKIGQFERGWNDFDYLDENTKLIHFTNLYTQPWKAKGHPHAGLWFQYLQEAIEKGFVTNDDINTAILRSYVRQDLLSGDSPAVQSVKKIGKKNAIKQLIKEFL